MTDVLAGGVFKPDPISEEYRQYSKSHDPLRQARQLRRPQSRVSQSLATQALLPASPLTSARQPAMASLLAQKVATALLF